MRHTTSHIAWRNLGRNKRRTLLALGAIALGQLTLVFVNCMMAGSYGQMLRTITGPLIGHVQIHPHDWREQRAMDLTIDHVAQVEAEIRALPGVTAVSSRIYAPVLAASGQKTEEPADAEPAVVIGVNVAGEASENGMLYGVDPNELPQGQSVVLGRVLANRLGVEAGQQLAVIGQDIDGFPATNLYTIGGIIESGLDIVSNRGIVMALGPARTLFVMPDRAHEIIVHGPDYRQADQLAGRIAQLPGLADAEVLPWRQVVPGLARMIQMKSWIDLIFLAIVFVAAAAGIANTAMMSTFERTHEFGMLLALGTAPRRIVAMVIVESVILGLLGVALGSIIGTTLVVITSHTGINYAALAGSDAEAIAYAGVNISYVIYPQFELRHVIFGVLAVTVTSILASTWPALLGARLEPAEAMRS